MLFGIYQVFRIAVGVLSATAGRGSLRGGMFLEFSRQHRCLQWGLMLSAIAGSPAESLAAPPPVEDFTRAPAIGEVAISPSGTRLALAVPAPNGRVQLAVM